LQAGQIYGGHNKSSWITVTEPVEL
jgi:hypothetical protein